MAVIIMIAVSSYNPLLSKCITLPGTTIQAAVAVAFKISTKNAAPGGIRNCMGSARFIPDWWH
ncbi:hypothetical protein [Photobacterium halotolerans]|uniref:hypothetical protein n=1 Tax=Photobacterium halotolerans TaxID=265726 RepID=UPI0013729092|nr:hypothetical protein [Photobacterium halotolerans]NAW87022.1 hypothetical protein [Photobacterium halotolerans]